MPTLFDIVAGYADRDPSRLALLTERDGTRTYGELTHRAAAFAVGLRGELGLPSGSRVCLWAVNRPEWVEAHLGAGAANMATVAANPEWTDNEIGYVFENSEAAVVVCDGNLAARAVALAANIPTLRHVIALTDEGIDAPDDAVSYDALVAGAPEDPRSQLPVEDAEPVAFLMYTSGTTTGRPKAVVARPVATAGVDYNEMFGMTSRDRGIVITPFFHGNGFGGVGLALGYGASVVFPRRFSASRFWRLADTYRPTYMMTLAPLVNILLGLPPGEHEKLHAFRVMIVLGSAGNAPIIEERFGVQVVDWYGMTEAGMGTYTRLNEPRKPGSAGRPVPGSGMLILGEDGKEAPRGVVGEVVFRRETLGFDGYLKDDEATTAALDDKYFHTGDLGRMDEDDYFFFVDRKKDIVRRGGENISSMEIESAMRLHPDVADAAVVAKPDPVLGERVVAFIVPTEGVSAPDIEGVKTHVGTLLAHLKVPEDIYVIEELPRTPTGKIEKFRLRQQL
jgi:acyl-CoA synthetase (AMP-forming)/AMP-acid ligase II